MNSSTNPLDRFRMWYSVQPRGLRLIVSINFIFYVFWILALQWSDVARTLIFDYVVLQPKLDAWLPVRLVLYNFVHVHPAGGLSGLINIAFNMLWLFWLGKSYETLHGSHRLFGLYLMGGMAGGVLFVLAGLAFPDFQGHLFNPIPAVIAVVCGVAIHYPNQGITLFLLGVVRLRYIAIGLVVLEVLVHPQGLPAYLGAVAFAFMFVRLEKQGLDLADWMRSLFAPKMKSARPSTARPPSGILERLEHRLSEKAEVKKSTSANRSAPGKKSKKASLKKVENATVVSEVEESEVDRILDKISESGYEALTDTEKKTLYEASQK